MSASRPEKWIVCRRPEPDAPARIFCAGWAGASANVFDSWLESMPNSLELRAIQLPGRMSRSKEECLASVPAIVDGIAQALASLGLFDKPFALFGHSMGAIIMFELARKLALTAKLTPQCLVVSGCRPPSMWTRGLLPRVSDLPRDGFLEHLVQLGGIPQELMDQPALLDYFLPPIRADYAALECYEPDLKSDPLTCPIVCLGGTEDGSAVRRDLAQWAHYTTEDFRLRMFAGGHFFLKDPSQREVLKYLSSVLVQW